MARFSLLSDVPPWESRCRAGAEHADGPRSRQGRVRRNQVIFDTRLRMERRRPGPLAGDAQRVTLRARRASKPARRGTRRC
jgi:hypothetical protein